MRMEPVVTNMCVTIMSLRKLFEEGITEEASTCSDRLLLFETKP